MAINYLYEKADKEGDLGIGYFYFHYTQKGKQTPSHITSKILKQIINQTFTPSQTMERPETLEKLYENSKKDCPPSSSQLVELCVEYSTRFDTIYILIDALDECDSDQLRDEIISVLREFAANGIKVLMMSQGQHLRRVQDKFQETEGVHFASMPIFGRDTDWKKYVGHRLKDERNVANLQPYVENLIRDSDGTYPPC